MFGLIDLLAEMASSSQDKQLASWNQLIIGNGDASTQLATVDSLIQDIHFSLSTTSWKELGWKVLALSGGEEYELLFTASTEVIDRGKRAVSCPITAVGEIIAEKLGGVHLVDINGEPFSLRKAGWEHFTAK